MPEEEKLRDKMRRVKNAARTVNKGDNEDGRNREGRN
jgi:hypothetical protein